MINDFYARSGIPPGTKVRLSAQLDGLTEQWVSEQYMTMMKSTYFSDIPVMMKVGKFLPPLGVSCLRCGALDRSLFFLCSWFLLFRFFSEGGGRGGRPTPASVGPPCVVLDFLLDCAQAGAQPGRTASQPGHRPQVGASKEPSKSSNQARNIPPPPPSPMSTHVQLPPFQGRGSYIRGPRCLCLAVAIRNGA